VGVALVPERPLAGRALSDEQALVAGAGGDDEEPPRAVPGVGVGEAGGADLGAVGGCPAAGGDLPVGVPVVDVQAGEVQGGAVVRGERGRGDGIRVDAGEGARWVIVPGAGARVR
jgi:hypothetical protein